MIYKCETCGYMFDSSNEVEQCPDCGKYMVKQADDKEILEYKQICREAELSEDIKIKRY